MHYTLANNVRKMDDNVAFEYAVYRLAIIQQWTSSADVERDNDPFMENDAHTSLRFNNDLFLNEFRPTESSSLHLIIVTSSSDGVNVMRCETARPPNLNHSENNYRLSLVTANVSVNYRT